MRVERLLNIIGSDFYTGVPDSQLKALCNYLISTYGIDPKHHVIAANEGNCTALAAGYHLATGKIPVVYMQNSGEGNIINPVASLLNEMVYAIPMIFIIGWRGEPGIHDEPQHIYQGEVTVRLLDDMDISSFVIGNDTTEDEVEKAMRDFTEKLSVGKQVAFIVRKGALSYDGIVEYKNGNEMFREEIIRHIVNVSGDDPIVCTTGKASRELFQIREFKAIDNLKDKEDIKVSDNKCDSFENNIKHSRDFLTVGSMGHCSSIALGVAINKPDRKVWCIDGDGAALMHLGAMAVVGANKPSNFIHVIINNGAHETVGGMPTVARSIDLVKVALACGYPNAVCVDTFEDLDIELDRAKNEDELLLLEVKCSIGSRENLGRPTITPIENKQNFMEYLKML